MKKIFDTDKYIILDGAMGTELQKSGLELGERPEILAITNGDKITEIHRRYVEAGSQIIYANTFGANAHKLQGFKYSPEEVIEAAIAAAKRACDGTETRVALDIGPLGEMLEPTGTLKFEEAYELFKEMVVAGEKAGADLVVFETMTDLYEVKAGVLAAKENSELPVMVSMTFEKNHRTFSGCGVEAMALTLEGLGVDAVGINCSLGPKEILPIAKELCNATSLPVFVKPNAGLPDPKTGAYSIDAREFAEVLATYDEIGINMVGGCCGTSPEFIKEVAFVFSGREHRAPQKRDAGEKVLKLCTPTSVVAADHFVVIGESINPMGRKFIKEAYRSHDMDTILACAVQQVEEGAEVLDVNTSLPDLDECQMLPETVKMIQAVVDAPIMLDCQNPEVLDRALRVYNGKAIINSTNADQALMEKIFPIAKKYGAAVVCLTLDEEGIPKTADQRLKLAERMVKKAESYGIDRSNLAVDCLTMAVSVQQEEAFATLEAIRLIKEKLGVNILLGVSNISFGLPRRDIINRNFLTMALVSGLDMAIMNPGDQGMMESVMVWNMMKGRDAGCARFIGKYQGSKAPAAGGSGGGAGAVPGSGGIAGASGGNLPVSKAESARNEAHAGGCSCPACNGDTAWEYLLHGIKNGLKNQVKNVVEGLIEKKDGMDIINQDLIPALDELGKAFEKGEIFLPQLIQGAQAAQAGFEVVNAKLAGQEGAGNKVSRGKIVLATVKGDIHDIGKNIVKIILQNYGYEIIDLGRDVPPEKVVEMTRTTGAPLVGLSALMTTTLKSMEETIVALHEAGANCKIMVGGAVLTEEYANEIKADFYARDAKASCDIAKEMFTESK